MANEIHGQLFDGKGSVTHMRNLTLEVVNANGFTSGETPGGTTVIRATGSEAAETETTDTDAGSDDDRSGKESLSTINQCPIDELNANDQAAKIQIATTRQTLREGCANAWFTVDDIQEALALDGDGEIDEAAIEARMEAAANASGFSIHDGDRGQELSVDRGEIGTAIEIMAEQPLDEETADDHTEEIETEAERVMAAQQQGRAVRPGDDDIDAGIESSAATDGGTDLGRDGDGDNTSASKGGEADPI